MNFNDLFPVLRTHKSDPDVFRNLRSEVSRVFDDFNRIFPMSENLDLANSGNYYIQPKIDVKETDKAIDIVVDVPGVKESDINVQLDGQTLTIKGERSGERQEDNKDYKIVERSFGSFIRSITLPFEADSDKVEAKLDSGVLTLSIEKPEEVAHKVKTVKISTSAGASDSAGDSEAKSSSEEGIKTTNTKSAKSAKSESESEPAPTA